MPFASPPRRRDCWNKCRGQRLPTWRARRRRSAAGRPTPTPTVCCGGVRCCTRSASTSPTANTTNTAAICWTTWTCRASRVRNSTIFPPWYAAIDASFRSLNYALRRACCALRAAAPCRRAASRAHRRRAAVRGNLAPQPRQTAVPRRVAGPPSAYQAGSGAGGRLSIGGAAAIDRGQSLTLPGALRLPLAMRTIEIGAAVCEANCQRAHLGRALARCTALAMRNNRDWRAQFAKQTANAPARARASESTSPTATLAHCWHCVARQRRWLGALLVDSCRRPAVPKPASRRTDTVADLARSRCDAGLRLR